MNDSMQQLQRAIQRARRGGPLKTWVLMHCAAENCPIQEVNVWVEEKPGQKAFQAPCRCPRDGSELIYEGMEA